MHTSCMHLFFSRIDVAAKVELHVVLVFIMHIAALLYLLCGLCLQHSIRKTCASGAECMQAFLGL